MSVSNERGSIRWFEVVYIVILVGVLAVSVFYMNPRRVGICDVAKVARATHVLERMAKADRQRQEEAYAKVVRLQQSHNQRMSELNRKLKSTAGEDRASIQGEIESTQETLQQNLAIIRQDLQRHQAQMFATFRKRLMPYIDAVAKKQKLDVILDPSNVVLFTKRAPDITEDVIESCENAFGADQPLIDPSLIETPGSGEKLLKASVGLPPSSRGSMTDDVEAPLTAPARPKK